MGNYKIKISTIFCFGLILAVYAFHPKSALARYSSIVIHANTGEILQASNPDRQRYPASLTKMMTLYMLFDAIHRGKLKLNQRLKVSRRAQGMPPSKLGLKRGQSISVKNAILALITKSANDVAVVVAESLGNTEVKFARLMTNKAWAMGMRKTRFRNASGLPNRRQVSTARDMATLARRLIKDFPKFYPFFGTERFNFKHRTYLNHNKLLISYPGVDGIKTGYIKASGFNLAASTKRNGHRLIGIIFGGRSAKSRDKHMKQLFERSYSQISKKFNLFVGLPVETRKQIKLHKNLPTPAVFRLKKSFGISQKLRHWAIQVGAFTRSSSARQAATIAARSLRGVAKFKNVSIFMHENQPLYRAQVVGMSRREAINSCKYLRQHDKDCVAIPPNTQ